MHFDFALIITLLTLASGIVWALDRFWLRKRRAERLARGEIQSDQPSKPVEYGRSFFPLLLIVLLFRSFMFEPFKIPSGSMQPTLLIGDFIVVSKFSYGLRLPVLNTKILDTGAPERGDVFVFRSVDQPGVNMIKRVIGLPGDTITYRDKVVYINGEPAPQEIVGPWIGEGINRNAPGARPQLRIEDLGDVEHSILIHPRRPGGRGQSWTVPEGHYFAMGDNRDRSLDSRSWGFVPEDHLVGRALRIWMHWDCATGFCVDFSRIGDKII
ncbi:MAG: signal peptidase I [Wenzhouxiangellaceae bacterium]|nr:signal peptidase I [Wenzhouxiangellaceae bacterium]